MDALLPLLGRCCCCCFPALPPSCNMTDHTCGNALYCLQFTWGFPQAYPVGFPGWTSCSSVNTFLHLFSLPWPLECGLGAAFLTLCFALTTLSAPALALAHHHWNLYLAACCHSLGHPWVRRGPAAASGGGCAPDLLLCGYERVGALLSPAGVGPRGLDLLSLPLTCSVWDGWA